MRIEFCIIRSRVAREYMEKGNTLSIHIEVKITIVRVPIRAYELSSSVGWNVCIHCRRRGDESRGQAGLVEFIDERAVDERMVLAGGLLLLNLSEKGAREFVLLGEGETIREG